jgi:NitT/TauT family transport system substrate-binding protein
MAVYSSFLSRGRLRTQRRGSILGALLLLSTLLAACDALPKATAEPDSVSLQLNWVHTSDFTGFYVADAKGYYAEENLNVDIRPRDPDDDVPPRQKLADGDADFAVLSMNRIRSLIEEGADPVGLSAAFQISPYVFFALEETGIQHPRDLVGKSVGIKSNSWRGRVHSTLEQVGIDPSEIVEVEVDFDAMEMLYDGEVDVWTGFINDEVVDARDHGYDVDLIFPADYAVGDYDGLITVLQENLDNDPALAQRFVRASLRGWEYAIQHPEEAGSIMAQWNDQHDVEFYQEAIHELVPLVDTGQVPIGWIDEARWQREMGDSYDAMAPNYNLDGLLSMPANRNWFSTVEQ